MANEVQDYKGQMLGTTADGTVLRVRVNDDGELIINLEAATVNIGDVDVLSLPELPAGNNNIGNVDIVTMPNVTIGTEIPAGTKLIGKVGFDQTTDGTTNKVQARNTTHDDLQVNANLQVNNADNSVSNPAFVEVTGSKVEVIDCIIAKDGTVSSEADISKYRYFSFLMPAGWDAATLTIKGSAAAAGTKQTIKNDAGQTFPVMTVAVDTVYAIDSAALMLAGVHFISFVASAAQTTAARTIKLMCKQ